MNYRNRALGVFLFAISGFALGANSVEAQPRTKNYGANRSKALANNNSISRFTTKRLQGQLNSARRDRSTAASLNFIGKSNAAKSNFSSKPFSSVSRSPAVSPYLGLTSSFNQATSYYNTVRPQQEQQRVNQQLSRQNYANQRRLNQLAAQGPYSAKGDQNSAPTGHAAVFQSLGNYLNTGGYFAGATRARPKSR